ncbi:hypothetical protein C5167_045923 [Papaver somniferum]|uniref:Rad21/Rec8-like protein N-terminal domain-containing protein n=1 Tax=Papaver somniferum TaxID=3469 RepID=A0A4Y7LF35_PAPSO|nr:hypothetical protein C5167_045923 [Papaver somniferum]
MFYSHQLLARKRPLGTVWMAAHLEKRLRRTHIDVTNIASTVDSIMFPEAPIALRLSAFLLLGVVRIYSRKVAYLMGDCDALATYVRTAFDHTKKLDLPENASAAPFESVTMPLQTFELDAVDLDLDSSINFESTPDNHLKTLEDITLEDQVPVTQDPYLDFFINEDINMDRDTSPQEMIPDSSSSQMEEDIPLAPGSGAAGDVSISSPNKQAEQLNKSVPEAHIPQEIPEIEVVRDADPNLNLSELPDILEGVAEKSLEQTENEKDTSPNSEHLLAGEQSEPIQHNHDPPTAFGSVESLGNVVSDISFRNESFEMAIQPTPPNEKEKVKSRKRKQFFDKNPVLSNKIMTGLVKDASMLVHKRRKLPCSSLDVWRFENRRRKDQIFYQSSVTGMSKSLQNLFERDYVSSRSQNIGPGDTQENAGAHTFVPDVDMEVDNQQPNVGTEVLPDVDTEVERIPPVVETETEHLQPDDNPEIEYGRFEDGSGSADRDFMTEFMATPTPSKTSMLEPQTGSLFETEVPSLDQTIRTEAVGSSVMKTPSFFSDRLGMNESASFSDIPGLLDSAEELNFLEADTTPVGNAVAQYLKNYSPPATETSQDQIGSLSLSKILHGKTRKQCARMFFETLVLTSFDYIKAHQEEAYGDISLTLTSRLKTLS